MKCRIIENLLIALLLIAIGVCLVKIFDTKPVVFTQKIGVDGYWINGQHIEQCRSFNVLLK